MSEEIGDWLADLCSSEPATATEVGAALAAVLEGDELASPPLVIDLAAHGASHPQDLASDVDYEYQRLLDALSPLRHELAEAASLTHDGTQHERLLSYQREVDRFRADKEVAKARLTAAIALRDIDAALDAAGAYEAKATETDLTVESAAAELAALSARADELRRSMVSGDEPTKADDAQSIVSGLLELHADPLAAEIRMLCAVEPAGTVTLLAVLEGEEAIIDHRDRAIDRAGDLLAQMRSGAAGDTETSGLTFADTTSFLERFFAGQESAIRKRAAEIGTAASLAVLRRRAGKSRAELAAKSGLPEPRIAALEAGDLRSALVHEVATYVRALGGRLDLTVGFRGEEPSRLV